MKNKRSYKNKVVVITGAAGGMGTSFAKQFGQAGAVIGLLDLKPETVNSLSKDLSSMGIKSIPVQCDVTIESDCQRAIQEVITKYGRIDVLINNAGITHRSAFKETDSSVLRKVVDVSLFGSIYCTKAALDSIISNSGQIIAISSIAGFAPLLGRSGYCAAKHALHGLFDSLRAELSGTGVSVLILAPGFTRTGISKAALDGDGQRTLHPQSTVGKISSPEEVAVKLFKAAGKNKKLLVLSPTGKLTRFLTRITPSLYTWIMKKSLKSELNRE